MGSSRGRYETYSGLCMESVLGHVKVDTKTKKQKSRTCIILTNPVEVNEMQNDIAKFKTTSKFQDKNECRCKTKLTVLGARF